MTRDMCRRFRRLKLTSADVSHRAFATPKTIHSRTSAEENMFPSPGCCNSLENSTNHSRLFMFRLKPIVWHVFLEKFICPCRGNLHLSLGHRGISRAIPRPNAPRHRECLSRFRFGIRKGLERFRFSARKAVSAS